MAGDPKAAGRGDPRRAQARLAPSAGRGRETCAERGEQAKGKNIAQTWASNQGERDGELP